MQTESYVYSLLSSALGILIVFVALIVLSGLMVALKKIFDRQKAAVKEEKVIPAGSQDPRDSDKDLGWLTAAVAAYLLLEDEDAAIPSASGWEPCAGVVTDPWMNVSRLRNTVDRSV